MSRIRLSGALSTRSRGSSLTIPTMAHIVLCSHVRCPALRFRSCPASPRTPTPPELILQRPRETRRAGAHLLSLREGAGSRPEAAGVQRLNRREAALAGAGHNPRNTILGLASDLLRGVLRSTGWPLASSPEVRDSGHHALWPSLFGPR